MKNKWIYWQWIIGILLAFLLGLTMGTGLGMQKGQYMLFEGLDNIFDGAQINIDLNETLMIDRATENMMPIINETLHHCEESQNQEGGVNDAKSRN